MATYETPDGDTITIETDESLVTQVISEELGILHTGFDRQEEYEQKYLEDAFPGFRDRTIPEEPEPALESTQLGPISFDDATIQRFLDFGANYAGPTTEADFTQAFMSTFGDLFVV